MLVVKRICITSHLAQFFINIGHFKMISSTAQLLSFRNEKAIWHFWQSGHPEPGYLVTCSLSWFSVHLRPNHSTHPSGVLTRDFSMKRTDQESSAGSTREIFCQICRQLRFLSSFQALYRQLSNEQNLSLSIKRRGGVISIALLSDSLAVVVVCDPIQTQHIALNVSSCSLLFTHCRSKSVQ